MIEDARRGRRNDQRMMLLPHTVRLRPSSRILDEPRSSLSENDQRPSGRGAPAPGGKKGAEQNPEKGEFYPLFALFLLALSYIVASTPDA